MSIKPLASVDDYFHRYPLPPEAKAIIARQDIDHDGALLWAVAKHVTPALLVELGTRYGVSTRLLRMALPDSHIIACDPTYTHEAAAAGVDYRVMRGEELYDTLDVRPDMLFIDTDPHSYDQTMQWLDTWVLHKLKPGGVALFHDTRSGGVAEAVATWRQSHPWQWQAIDGLHGMGALWKPPLNKKGK